MSLAVGRQVFVWVENSSVPVTPTEWLDWHSHCFVKSNVNGAVNENVHFVHCLLCGTCSESGGGGLHQIEALAEAPEQVSRQSQKQPMLQVAAPPEAWQFLLYTKSPLRHYEIRLLLQTAAAILFAVPITRLRKTEAKLFLCTQRSIRQGMTPNSNVIN